MIFILAQESLIVCSSWKDIVIVLLNASWIDLSPKSRWSMWSFSNDRFIDGDHDGDGFWRCLFHQLSVRLYHPFVRLLPWRGGKRESTNATSCLDSWHACRVAALAIERSSCLHCVIKSDELITRSELHKFESHQFKGGKMSQDIKLKIKLKKKKEERKQEILARMECCGFNSGTALISC